MLYLSRDTPPSAVFSVQTSTGGALSVILFFELSCYRAGCISILSYVYVYVVELGSS